MRKLDLGKLIFFVFGKCFLRTSGAENVPKIRPAKPGKSLYGGEGYFTACAVVNQL